MEQKVQEYLASGKDTLSVIISGKMGVGKSAMVNSLVGQLVVPEATDPLSVTTTVRSIPIQIEASDGQRKRSVEIRVNDTPGFGDPLKDDLVTIDEIAEKCKEKDLLVYCVSMRSRISQDDVSGLVKLTERVGPEILKNTLFALTFANEVKLPPGKGNNPEKERDNFQVVYKKWLYAFEKILKEKLSLKESAIHRISIVPVGYQQEQPSDRKDWLSTFWFEAFRMTKDAAQPVLLGLNLRRMSIGPASLSLSIVIAGPKGIGKSSLVNALVGENVATEATTTTINPFQTEVEVSNDDETWSINITVNDTPALGVDTGDVLEKIAERCTKGNLLVYCMDIRNPVDAASLKALTQRAGPEIWKNTVFALTNANHVKPPPYSDHFKRVMGEWEQGIKKVLQEEIHVPADITDKVTIVPIGYQKDPPPDRDDWLTPLWVELFLKCQVVHPKLLQSNEKRITVLAKYDLRKEENIDILVDTTNSEDARAALKGKRGASLLAGALSVAKGGPISYIARLIFGSHKS